MNLSVFSFQFFSEIEEFCNMETFEAKCNEKEVVVMDTARYGRMRLGRCVKKNYGNIGCVKDVLTLADAKCSGRRECTVKLPDDDLYQMQPCPNDVTSHLETGYSCFPGEWLVNHISMTTTSHIIVIIIVVVMHDSILTHSHSGHECQASLTLTECEWVNNRKHKLIWF